jgi:hypothetical protein
MEILKIIRKIFNLKVNILGKILYKKRKRKKV